MAFLAGLAANLVEWGLTKLVGALSTLVSKLTARRETIEAAKASVQPLKDAKTGDEIDKSSDSTLGGI